MPPVAPPLAPQTELLAGLYRRLGAASPLLRIGAGLPGEGGQGGPGGGEPVGARRLAEDRELVDRLVTAEEQRIVETYGVAPRRDLAATWVLHRYAFTATLAMSGPWYLERRVPRLALDDVVYGPEDRTLRVLGAERVSCLPGDPRAETLLQVPDEEALRAELRSAVADHLAPVLTAFRPLLRRGPRALWGLATDELADGLWHLGRCLGDQSAAARAAEELLPGGTAPYAGSTTFRPAPEGRGEMTRTRTGCCLLYTIRPDELCATCPRIRRG